MSIQNESALRDHCIQVDLPCNHCGYNLRGVSELARCPECGQTVASSIIDQPAKFTMPQRRWLIVVLLGLMWMLYSVPGQAWVVLNMRFGHTVTGSAPRLNVPAPKVWAVPLVQRSLGYMPESPGMRGTMLSMLGVIAVWLITSPRTQTSWHERALSLRRATRWGTIILVGGFFGFMMNAEHLNWDDVAVEKYVAIGIALVEVPCTILLYLYLAQLAGELDQRPSQRLLRRNLLVMVPLMVIAVVLLGLGQSLAEYRKTTMAQAFSSTYVAACIATALVATAAVVQMILALLPRAIPWLGRWLD